MQRSLHESDTDKMRSLIPVNQVVQLVEEKGGSENQPPIIPPAYPPVPLDISPYDERPADLQQKLQQARRKNDQGALAFALVLILAFFVSVVLSCLIDQLPALISTLTIGLTGVFCFWSLLVALLYQRAKASNHSPC